MGVGPVGGTMTRREFVKRGIAAGLAGSVAGRLMGPAASAAPGDKIFGQGQPQTMRDAAVYLLLISLGIHYFSAVADSEISALSPTPSA